MVCLIRCKNLAGNYSDHLRHLKTKQCIHLHNPKKYSFLGHKWAPIWSEVFLRCHPGVQTTREFYRYANSHCASWMLHEMSHNGKLPMATVCRYSESLQKVDKSNLPQGQPKQSLKQRFKRVSVFLKSSVKYQNGSGTKYGHTASELLERVHR